uniref:Uncharacterized protein n=1 Tax=Oryza punctata TaxID=4537 RepID=A0A0E0LG73_ORYPU
MALRSFAAGRAVRRDASSGHSFHAGRSLSESRRRPLFSPLNRHNHEVNALLEEIKETPINLVTEDTIIKTVHHSILARQQILVQNIVRSWVASAAAIAGYCWGYNRVDQCSGGVGSEPMKEHA